MSINTISTENHFIQDIIENDIKSGKHKGIVTRFPPEPNGYLHIGHAKSICLNFGIASSYKGRCHLRFDDTNPTKEDVEYVQSIQEDIRWLGFDWGEHLHYASDYFELLFEYAVQLIKAGKAYVCTLGTEEFKKYRGVPGRPGKDSPWRNRSIEENLDLLQRMRDGEFPDGAYVLRAKIDMASPNLHMRDPAIYRIKHAAHHRTGNKWNIYPMYDFAHCLSDAIENITHSLCSIEFEVHRPLYDWILDQLQTPCHPRQIEFARLNLSYTIMSKRNLQQLVELGIVSGWDDPRMPTLAGLRRRGYPQEAIRAFCEKIGVTKYESLTDIALLEHCAREYLNKHSLRAMAVLHPLKVVIENYPEDMEETFSAVNNPEDPDMGSRQVPFSRTIYIERDDFSENPPPKFFRLAPGREVRLRYACYITCKEVIKDKETGVITEVRCTFDPNSRGGGTPDGRKVKGTLHWVSAKHAFLAEIRLYDRLFKIENPTSEISGHNFQEHLNPNSIEILSGLIEPSLANSKPGSVYQFERQGYFCIDTTESISGKPVFNRTVSLRDSWAKMQKKAN